MSLTESLRFESRARRPLCLAIALAFSSSALHAATITVNDASDAATPTSCTLRAAIESVNAGVASSVCSSVVSGTFGSADTIVFDDSLVNATITLSQGELAVTVPVIIQGRGQTIDAQGQSRVLYVNRTNLDANNLTIAGGYLDGDNGGGVYAAYSTVTLTNTTITRNSIRGHGGGICSFYGTLTLSNVAVTGNSGTSGGGVYIDHGTASMVNTTITGNLAGDGGGVNAYGASVTLTNATVTGNSAQYYGGGINGYNHAAITLANSIVAGNTCVADPDLSLVNASTTTSNHSLLGTALQATYPNSGNVFSDDPGVETLADNGGSTQTMALRPNSPAVNAGSNALVPVGVQFDQRGPGYPRIFNTTVDIGAFEFSDRIFADGFESTP